MSHTRYPPARQRLQRSELAVPGSNPSLFEKAAASDVDYVFLDLEDAVAPGDKEAARTNIIEALGDIDWRGLGKTSSIRNHMHKKVVAYIAGLSAPKWRTMGHAGAIVSAIGESAAEKVEIMKECGVTVVERPSQFGQVVSRLMPGPD